MGMQRFPWTRLCWSWVQGKSRSLSEHQDYETLSNWSFDFESALRKTSHLLLGLSRLVPNRSARPPITYYALDLEQRELERTLGEISSSDIGKSLEGRVETKGMCATYNDGLKYVEDGGLNFERSPSQAPFTDSYGLRGASPISSEEGSLSSTSDYTSSPPSTPGDTQPPLHILFLGSSLGNFSREGSVEFLRSLPLRPGSGDTLLLGMDHDNAKHAIEEAYNDREGYTKRFIMNGLKAAGRALGNEKMFDEDKWEYVNHYNTVCPFFRIPFLLTYIYIRLSVRHSSVKFIFSH